MYLVLAVELGSVRVTAPPPSATGFEGLNGSWRTGEVWHSVAELKYWTRAQKILGNIQHSCSKGPQQFCRFWYHKMITRNSSSSGVDPAGGKKTSCVG